MQIIEDCQNIGNNCDLRGHSDSEGAEEVLASTKGKAAPEQLNNDKMSLYKV